MKSKVFDISKLKYLIGLNRDIFAYDLTSLSDFAELYYIRVVGTLYGAEISINKSKYSKKLYSVTMRIGKFELLLDESNKSKIGYKIDLLKNDITNQSPTYMSNGDNGFTDFTYKGMVLFFTNHISRLEISDGTSEEYKKIIEKIDKYENVKINECDYRVK